MRFGFASDNLISAGLAMADGAVAWCDATHKLDLSWAIKGGGELGVVTSMADPSS